MAHPDDVRREGGPSPVRISVTVADHYTFDTPLVTGRQIKETAGVPAGFSLYRRTRGGNEPILDEAQGGAPQRRPLLRAAILEPKSRSRISDTREVVMGRPRAFAIVLGAVGAAAAAVIVRHGRGAMGRAVPGGILIRHASTYDALAHRLLLGPLFDRVAADVAAVAPTTGARALEVGCGPGRLSIRLGKIGLDVTGLDLDPGMIERARVNAERSSAHGGRRPSFLVGDVASLAFPDGAFDLVVSTLSMHHWADPAAGLAEIARVLRPGGRALVWDFRAGLIPFHGHLPDPTEHMRSAPLCLVSATPWRWPWWFSLTQRIELANSGSSSASAGT